MGNVWVIAKKEFTDLISNRLVLLVLIALLIYSLSDIYNFYVVLNGWEPGAHLLYNQNLGISADNNVFMGLTWFGTIIGIVIGCSMISSERAGNALNTLVVKPVYRDTIINGKLLGGIIFFSSIIFFFIAIFTAVFFVLCGSALAPFLSSYFSLLPFVYIYIMVFVLVFLSLSMLISLLIRDQAFSMIISILTVYISMNGSDISHNLNNLFPGSGLGQLVVSLSPYSMLWDGGVQNRFMNTSLGAWDAFLGVLPDFVRLSLIVVVTLVLSYIIFVRSDIS